MNKPVHVLLIDDEANILASLKRNLLAEPFTVVTTSIPEEAFRWLVEYPIKVVISDQRMPLMEGVEFLKKVKESHPDVIRILLTGHADVQAAEEAVNVGQVYRFLTKPWDPENLKTTLRQAMELYDITLERRRLFEELKHRNEELLHVNESLKDMYERQRDFTSTVSHELRTPLSSIKMAMDIILSGTPGPVTEDQTIFLNKAKSNVDRLHRLINDILDLTKMESGKIAMKVEPGDFLKVVKECVESQMEVARAKGLTLSVIGNNLPEVCFDKDRIAQVFLNLLGNALKFTDTGGVTVRISIPEDKNIVEVRVEDTGPGIKSEDIGRLFEKFQQLEGKFNNKSGGTGLGLAICKTIIDCHGGRIWAESEVGKGSAFCFVIPLTERRKG